MIKKIEDKILLASFLKAMYNELQPDSAKDFQPYVDMAEKYLANDYCFTDNKHRGMFIMKDESVPALPTRLWNGVAVYIKPEYRKSRLLKEFYAYMFDNFKGTIMGYTEVNSEHNKVLLKRHNLLGYVYEMNRS